MAKTATRQVSIFINGKEVENSVKAISGEFKKASNEIAKMTIGSDEYIAKMDDIKKLKPLLDAHNKELRGIADGQKKMNLGMESFVGVAAGAFAVDEIIGYGKQLFNMGVEMESMNRKAKIVFGESLPFITAEAEKNAQAIGFTNQQYIAAAANIQDLLVPMGFQRQEAASISAELVNLSGALSEWSGGQLDAKGVSEVLNDALLGERESLKQLGISISQADVDAALLAKGLDKLTGASKQQAEASATLELILSKSQDAQTAYAESTGSMAKQSAQASAKFKEIAEKLATVLLPVFNRLLTIANKLADVFVYITDPMSAYIDKNDSLAESLQNTQAEFNSEIEVLKAGNWTQDERKKLIEEINSKYKEYLPNLLSEKSSIEQITAAQEAANKVFTQKILYVALQEEITAATKRAAEATKSAFAAEKARLEYLKTGSQDNAGYENTLKQQANFAEGLRKMELEVVKNTPKTIDGIKEQYKVLAEELGTTLSELEKRFATTSKGGKTGGEGDSLSDKEIEALKEEADWRRINAEMIRNQPTLVANVNALIAEEQAKQNEQNRAVALAALNTEMEDYIKLQNEKKLVDVNYLAEKEAAKETIRFDLLTEQEREIELLGQHYQHLIFLAEKYGLDTTALKEEHARKQKEVEVKYAKESAEEQRALQEQKLAALQSSFSAFGDFVTATFDLLGAEGEKSAEFQKLATLAKIAFDTASAIASLVAASEANPGNAFTFGAAGTAQFISGIARIVANIASAKKALSSAPKVQQKYEGGYQVTGAQDGRSYTAAMIAPPSTGLLPGHPVLFQSAATGRPVLASERGSEYFVSAESLRDPYVANMVRMIDLASKGVQQFATGGANPANVSSTDSNVLSDLNRTLATLTAVLSSGILAVLPDDTLIKAKQRVDKINSNTGNYY